MSVFEWCTAVFSSLPLGCITLLTVAVMFVNGWTDAPNAIASCVVTRALPPGAAVGISALCNLIGLTGSVLWNRTVADTVWRMVDFGAGRQEAQVALCAGLFAVVAWAVTAWYFGIPTSESHALLAGISGAALAVNGANGVRMELWRGVLWGLGASVIFGFLLGGAFFLLLCALLSRSSRRRVHIICRKAQIIGGISNSLLHGAQDGQKFIGVLLITAGIASGAVPGEVPLWMTLFCSVVLFLGTSLGGYRIIRTVGVKMVRLREEQGVAADLAAAVCLFFCTLFGVPVSTTHVKTCAVLGAGAAYRPRSVHWQVAGQMGAAWALTFPCCGVLGWLAAKLFLTLFL